MRVTPPARRSTTQRTAAGFEIRIPGRFNPAIGVFLIAWLGGWTAGGWNALQTVLGQWHRGAIEYFLVFWLIGWLMGEVIAIGVIAYMAAGAEIIRLAPGSLSLRREAFGIGRTREYDTLQIRNLRLAPSLPSRRIMRGTIAFDYGASTIRFASDVEEAEAATIVEELKGYGLLK